jgi:hypothetical protein
MKAILVAVLIVATCAASASADVLYPAALTLEPGLAYGPPSGFPWMDLPDLGTPLVMEGRVATVGAPFDDLLPGGDWEITWVFEGSTCTQRGNWDDFQCAGGLFATYEGGTLTLYLDTSPDANIFDPASFRDGEMVLQAQTSIVNATDNDPHVACPQRPDEPDVIAFFSFVGGTWFSRVSDNGTGLAGTSRGELDNGVPPGLEQLFTFRVDGVVDVYGPVATEATTWGRVKAMYR